MVPFLSDAWIDALDRAARADDRLAELATDLDLTVEQHVTNGPDGDVTYHVRIADGTVRVASGPTDADIRFHQDHETAVAIAAGLLSAQRAFMAGQLQIGGDLRHLLDHREILAALHDAFATVRAGTTGLTPSPTTPSSP